MGSWFLNATFLGWGAAALVSAPVLIHLINRYRFRRVQFAAMEFLLASQQRNRRRVLIEQLLLLLLRILLVLGLIALIARLVLDPSALSLLRGAEVHHVVLLDDSASMHDRWGETSAFDESQGVVKGLVAASLAEGGGQRLTLIRLSRPEQPEYNSQKIDQALQADLEPRLEAMKCSHQRLELASGLTVAAQLLASQATGIKHLHVISDFRLDDWSDPEGLVDLFERLDEDDVSVNLVRTVPERHANLAVTGLDGELQVASAGVPVKLTVQVDNLGEQRVGQVNLAVYVDEERLPLAVTLEGLEAGETIEQAFEVTFETPGKHQLAVRLPGDALPVDDHRFLAVEVAPSNRVLVIEGDPAREEGLFPTLALAANPQASGYQVIVATPDYLYRHGLDEFQSILMLNVPELSPDAIESLDLFVRGGGGLVWYLGDSINAASYNTSLYNEGQGLFPVPLGQAPLELPRDNIAAPGPDLVLTPHAMLDGLQGSTNPEIEATRVFRYFPVAENWERDDRSRADRVTTVARLRNGQPLLLEHRIGTGRVMTCLTSCGTDWTNFAQYRSFVPFHFELQKYISRADRVLAQVAPGRPIRFDLDPAQFGELVRFDPPENSGQVSTEQRFPPKPVEPAAADGAGPTLRRLVEFDRTDSPGVYRVRLVDAADVNVERWFAFNPEVEESRLELIGDSQLKAGLGPELASAVRIQKAGSAEWLEGRESDRDVREWILILLILVLLAEQLLAYRLSYHPPAARVAA